MSKLLKLLFFLSAILLFFAIYFHTPIEFDQDLGRHLLTGKIIWQTHEIPKINLFSYTWTDYPFVNTHWLAEVIFFLVNQNFGLFALLILKVAVMIAALTLILYIASKYTQNLLATALAFTLLVPVLLERTEIRPEIFSYFATSVFLFILIDQLLPKTTGWRAFVRPRLIWLLPIVEIFWVNTHIYFILGPILVTIFLLSKLWQSLRQSQNIAAVILNSKFLILNSLLVYAATLINPHGLKGALYPLTVLNNYGYSIVENQTPFFLESLGVANPNILYFKIALLATIASFLITDLKKIPPSSSLLATLVILSILHIRSFPYLFLLELPVVAHNLANIRPYFLKMNPWNPSTIRGIAISIVIILTLLRFLRLTTNDYYLAIDSQKRTGSAVSESYKPALDFVVRNTLRGPIFNNFDIGSYLDYRLYPQEKVFVDGRPEAYPKEFFQNLYIPMQLTQNNFQKVDDIYHFNLIIFSHTDATPWAEKFLSDTSKNSRWTMIYLDPSVVIFAKTSTTPEIVKKYQITPASFSTSYQLPTTSYLRLLSLARATSIFGWSDPSQKLLNQAYFLNSSSKSVRQALNLPVSSTPTLF